MANALRNTDADEAHQSSTEASEDEDMGIRESQALLPVAEENEEDNEPWINVTSRARRRRLQTRSTTPQLSRTPPKPVLRQSRPAMRKPREPPLPADDYKLAVRPRNGRQLNKHHITSNFPAFFCGATSTREPCHIAEPATRQATESTSARVPPPHPSAGSAALASNGAARVPPSVLSVRRESPDGNQNLPQQIPATRQSSETAAGPESRLLVSETTWRALSFPQVAIPETTRSCPGEEQFQAAFWFRFQAQDLIATTDAIPWQDLEPWTFRKWQEGKQASCAGHAAACVARGCSAVTCHSGYLTKRGVARRLIGVIACADAV
ncbi:hypothetical protein HPB49_003706 [Dermacentor silvarum]|uniref:Uncharacterized protein n=1 Tax=Dermacentor silvarum TaxID=543639 RepID=A0ACB8DU17_DERSI|nr:hypothetical protein HPB49_003706 [Dermacentor silvarum]